MRIGDYEVRKLTGKDVIVTKCYGAGEDIVLPDSLDGLRPVAIGGGFLPRRNKVHSITLPSSVEEIDSEAFPAMRTVRRLEVHGRRLRSKDGVLYDGDLRTLVFYPPEKDGDEYIAPPQLRVIAETAFAAGTRLRSLVLPGSMEKLDFKAQSAPLLSDVYIGDGKRLRSSDGVVYKGKSLVFYPWGKGSTYLVLESGTERLEADLPPTLCGIHAPSTLQTGLERASMSLSELSVESGNRFYQSQDSVLFSSDTLLRYPARKPGAFYIVPGWVRRVADGAFQGSRLDTVVLSEGVEDLGSEVFSGSSVETLVLPRSLQRIDLRALSGMDALKELWIGRSSYAEVFLSAIPGEFKINLIAEKTCSN